MVKTVLYFYYCYYNYVYYYYPHDQYCYFDHHYYATITIFITIVIVNTIFTMTL